MDSGGSSGSKQVRTTRADAGAAAGPAQQRATVSVVGSIASDGLGAVATVSARMVGFGALGFFLGGVGFFIERGTGLLAHPWEPWDYAVYVLLLLQAIGGAFTLGMAGMWRGIGRVAMNLTEKYGLVGHIVNRVFERAAVLVAGTSTPEVLRRPLPIQRVREALHQASAAYAESEDVEKGTRGLWRSILRRLKRYLSRRLESRFIELVGEETRDMGAAELTLARLHERAMEEAEGQVEDLLDGLRNKQAGIWALIFAALLALPPLVLALLR
jgi:hypothetical protein